MPGTPRMAKHLHVLATLLDHQADADDEPDSTPMKIVSTVNANRDKRQP